MTQNETERLIKFVEKSMNYSYYFSMWFNHRKHKFFHLDKNGKHFTLKISNDFKKVKEIKRNEEILEVLNTEAPYILKATGSAEFLESVFGSSNWKKVYKDERYKSYIVYF